LQEWFDLLVGMTMTLGTAGTLYLGVMHVRAGVLTLGDLILIIAYVSQLYDPLKAISKKMTDLQSALASAERAFTLLDEAPEVVEHPHARRLERARGEVRFENVSFSYDGKHPVLSDVNLVVPAGTRAGIQGKTGAGKSTLMSLLTRFYDVSGGRILLDGVDIREFRLSDFRDQFGIVLQDAVLFSTTVAENICYGRNKATEEEIVRAAQLANAHDFIVNLPDGYNTLVGERGMRLSGGERQRIALARAFLRDAPILILDEPTSALDMKTEAAILEALERLMAGRTTFVIAHRLGTLDGCDMQLEMRDGTLLQRAVAAAAGRVPSLDS
ncbi:MAG TPA: ABC transporter ATP-binding protein, partial [Bryobacteraceae bacterium]|nr:ABC transporter ATP-binding protein [Bryobacteraceae bacterium]